VSGALTSADPSVLWRRPVRHGRIVLHYALVSYESRCRGCDPYSECVPTRDDYAEWAVPALRPGLLDLTTVYALSGCFEPDAGIRGCWTYRKVARSSRTEMSRLCAQACDDKGVAPI